VTGRDARGARTRPGRAGPLSLIHTNKSPNPILARVSGRLRLKPRTVFFVGALNEEDFDLVDTLVEAHAIRERLLAAGRGPVVVARLVPRGEANETT